MTSTEKTSSEQTVHTSLAATTIIRDTVSKIFLERVKTTPSKIGFQFKATYPELGSVGAWTEWSYREFYLKCRLVSFGLMGLGLKPGDRAGIISNTRIEWSLSDMAILGAGAVTVPIYASSTAEDSAYIVEHAEIRVIFAEDSKQVQKFLQLRQANPKCMPSLEKIVVFEPSAVLASANFGDLGKMVLTFQALDELGKREEARNPTRFDENLSASKPSDPLTICYTSGTTGVPKGVIVTQDNMVSVLEDAGLIVQQLDSQPEQQIFLSFLPFSHVIGKVESMIIYALGCKQIFAENIDKIVANMGEVRPTILFSVPRIFEKAFARVLATVDAGSPLKKTLFHWAMKAGRNYYSQVWAGQTPTLLSRLEYETAKRLVFHKVAARFGGRLGYAICGGAPLPQEIGEFFQIIGISILEGYGLTETCGPITVNTPRECQFGRVGKPLPEVSIKLGDDGEVLCKSRKVFAGYYKMEKETSEVLKDGWFSTGDIGTLDSKGSLKITDRKKDLIVTSGGKNVAPQKIENIAKSQKYVSQFVVHGDRRNYLTALVTLDKDGVIKYAQDNQILFSEYVELIKNPKIISLVQRIVDDVNKHLASYESIKKFVILPQDFSVETGELTPSLKIKRRVVGQKFKAELDSMYADSAVRFP
ncbi:MAG: long-chain fatty acid--CoA ligase [Bdellovibrio sp.]|nr:long-chain fatty acid--CoA ligase [Bdellovibrio sp.]